MKPWLMRLQQTLDQRSAAHLRRHLVPRVAQGAWLTEPLEPADRKINLASNDYLGLAQHPHIKQTAIQAIERHGFGSGASRLVVGHTPEHQAAEQAFADLKHAQAALLFPSGYMANHAVLTSLAGDGDLICLDKLNHASLIDAAHASSATVRVFAHRQYEKAARLLARHQQEHGDRRQRLLVSDSVFSMDGDVADLPTMADLAERYQAILVIDEAHGTGVLGDDGSGLAQAQGVVGRVDVTVSTASKALGGLGGIVTADQPVIDALVNFARPFIYTTAIPAAQAAAIAAAVELIHREAWRREILRTMSIQLRQALGEMDWPWPAGVERQGAIVTPIIPLLTGSAQSALALESHLRQAGFMAAAIRPPTVAPNTARVRLSLRADLPQGTIQRLIDELRRWRLSDSCGL